MIFFLFAGNQGATGVNTIMWPAKHQSVICVGACNAMGKKMDMSAEGPEIDFLCPGEKVDSTGIFWAHLCNQTRKSLIKLLMKLSASCMKLYQKVLDCQIWAIPFNFKCGKTRKIFRLPDSVPLHISIFPSPHTFSHPHPPTTTYNFEFFLPCPKEWPQAFITLFNSWECDMAKLAQCRECDKLHITLSKKKYQKCLFWPKKSKNMKKNS